MNEQTNNRTVAMRAERDVDNIFYAVREEMGYDGPKYKTANEIWLEGAKRTARFFSEISRDSKTDEKYFAAVGNELSHIIRITKESFKKPSAEQNKESATPVEDKKESAPMEKTATAEFFGKKENVERLSKKEHNNRIIFAKKRADEVQYAYI